MLHTKAKKNYSQLVQTWSRKGKFSIQMELWPRHISFPFSSNTQFITCVAIEQFRNDKRKEHMKVEPIRFECSPIHQAVSAETRCFQLEKGNIISPRQPGHWLKGPTSRAAGDAIS